MLYNAGMVALPVAEHDENSVQRLYRRARQLWSGQVAEEIGVGSAAVYARNDLGQIAEANCVIGEVAAEGWAEIREQFAAAGTAMMAWHLPWPEVAPEGMVRQAVGLYRLGGQQRGLPMTHAELTIIPARASFPHVQQIAAEMYADAPTAQAQEAVMCHLDDSRVDAVVAIAGERAVAYASVLSTGEAGFVQELFVAPEFRGRGYSVPMMGWALDICERSAFKQVLWAMEEGEGLARRYGFAKEGEVVGFVARR